MSAMSVTVDFKIVHGNGGYCVSVEVGGKEIHRTIEYADRHFAELHAKELGERASEFVIKSQLEQ